MDPEEDGIEFTYSDYREVAKRDSNFSRLNRVPEDFWRTESSRYHEDERTLRKRREIPDTFFQTNDTAQLIYQSECWGEDLLVLESPLRSRAATGQSLSNTGHRNPNEINRFRTTCWDRQSVSGIARGGSPRSVRDVDLIADNRGEYEDQIVPKKNSGVSFFAKVDKAFPKPDFLASTQGTFERDLANCINRTKMATPDVSSMVNSSSVDKEKAESEVTESNCVQDDKKAPAKVEQEKDEYDMDDFELLLERHKLIQQQLMAIGRHEKRLRKQAGKTSVDSSLQNNDQKGLVKSDTEPKTSTMSQRQSKEIFSDNADSPSMEDKAPVTEKQLAFDKLEQVGNSDVHVRHSEVTSLLQSSSGDTVRTTRSTNIIGSATRRAIPVLRSSATNSNSKFQEGNLIEIPRVPLQVHKQIQNKKPQKSKQSQSMTGHHFDNTGSEPVQKQESNHQEETKEQIESDVKQKTEDSLSLSVQQLPKEEFEQAKKEQEEEKQKEQLTLPQLMQGKPKRKRKRPNRKRRRQMKKLEDQKTATDQNMR